MKCTVYQAELIGMNQLNRPKSETNITVTNHIREPIVIHRRDTCNAMIFTMVFFLDCVLSSETTSLIDD